MEDGDALRDAFEQAGFGDFLCAPPEDVRVRLSQSKLPVLDDPWSKEVALDTQYTLRANADLSKHQARIDAALRDAEGA